MKKNTNIVLSFILASSLYANENLKDVLITAKTNSQTIDTAGSFTVITKKDIEENNIESIQNILENTVGINASANSRSINGRKNITFRGMNPEHTAILINGKKLSNTDAQIGHSDFQYNWIPISAIEKIEIIRGPMSSLYGSKAMGGVVNIITQKPLEAFAGNIKLKYSKPETSRGGVGKDISLNLSGQITDKLATSLYLEKKLLDEMENINGQINNETLNNPSEFEGKDISNAMLNLWYTIDDEQEISMSILKGKELRDGVSVDLFKGLERQIKENKKETNSYFDELYDIDKNHYSVNYDKFLDFGNLNLKVYRTDSDIHAQSFKYTHKLIDDVLATELSVDSFDNNYLIFGAEYRKEKYEKIIDDNGKILPIIGKERKGFSDNIDFTSLYFQDELELHDNFLLTLGARYDKHEKFGGEFSPKVYGVYKLDNNQRLKLGYGKGFNAPTLTQLSDSYTLVNPNAGHAFKGNSKLKPEISDTYELGYEYNNSKDIFKTTLFYTKLKDLIATKKTNISAGFGLNYEIYSNINSAILKGLELEYTRESILRNLDFIFNYTYLHTKDEQNNRELNFRPEHKIDSSIKYNLDSNTYALLSIHFVGEQVNYDDIEREFTKMEEYVTSRVQLSKNFTKNLNASFGITNLTDKRLSDGYNYQLRPRTYYLALDYKF